MARLRGLLNDLGWGALWGLLFSGIYIVLLGALFLLQGPRMFRDYGTSFGEVALLYVIGGIGGGLIVGIFRPVLRWRWGAALIGALAAIPIGASVLLTI